MHKTFFSDITTCPLILQDLYETNLTLSLTPMPQIRQRGWNLGKHLLTKLSKCLYYGNFQQPTKIIKIKTKHF